MKVKLPIHSSGDLVNWRMETYVFFPTTQPKWAVEDFWAPEIHIINNIFVVYFAARDTTGVLCVGVAYSTKIFGPYTDIGAPLVRNESVGNIDPHYFFDSGIGYLFWKEDGNGKVPPEKYTPIWAQPLTSNGLQFTGSKVLVLKNDPNSWEGPLVEGPWVMKTNNSYYLFYSANGYASPNYAVGVARSNSLLGPYTKWSKNPILHSNSHWSGPGHCTVIEVVNSNGYAMLYHSWAVNEVGGNYSRLLMMDAVQWDTSDNIGWPYIQNFSPSYVPTPVPPL